MGWICSGCSILIWLSIRVAGSNSSFLKQGSQSQASFLASYLQDWLSGDQYALVPWGYVRNDFLQSSPQQPFGSISLNCIAH